MSNSCPMISRLPPCFVISDAPQNMYEVFERRHQLCRPSPGARVRARDPREGRRALHPEMLARLRVLLAKTVRTAEPHIPSSRDHSLYEELLPTPEPGSLVAGAVSVPDRPRGVVSSVPMALEPPEPRSAREGGTRLKSGGDGLRSVAQVMGCGLDVRRQSWNLPGGLGTATRTFLSEENRLLPFP